MKTVSINVMNLCVPCANRCRYCLLSYDGNVRGADYGRSEAYARRFHDWIRQARPELSFLFGFGYAMEHPELLRAVDFCQSIGSPTGEMLQMDGMRFRTEGELEALLTQLQAHGVRQINLTFYGAESYHDRFAARAGDFQLLMHTLQAAKRIGLTATVGIPLTCENAAQAEMLIDQLEAHQPQQIRCFVPHGEGRGRTLEPIRLSRQAAEHLPDRVRERINWNVYRTESEWLQAGFPAVRSRMLALTLTQENIAAFEQMPFGATIAYLEKLDDDYYAAVPTVEALAERYGDPSSTRYYSARDLYLHYQQRYLREENIRIYDMNDERQCFSRRF